MIFKSTSYAMAVAMAVCFSGNAHAQTYETPVTPSFFDGEIAGDGLINPVFRYRWYVQDRDGRIALCGIGHLRDAGVRSTMRRMARNATFFLNEQTFTVNLTHFTQARRAAELQSGTATCSVTDIPSSGGTVDISYGTGTSRN